MANHRSVAPALVLAVMLSTSASAGPIMRYSWDDCDPVIPRRDFGPAAVYTQTVSALALEGPVHDFSLLIRIPFPLPSAWVFEDLCYYGCYPAPCQSNGRTSAVLGGTACDTIPGLHVNAYYLFPVTGPFRAYLGVEGHSDGSFTPDPSRRYTLFRMAFDHSMSVAGSGAPGTCGDADVPFLFEIGEFHLNGVDQFARATWENCVLGWNASWSPPTCPLIVPVRNRTWGQVKMLYR